MKFKPLGERICRASRGKCKDKLGLIIPDNAKEKPLMGIVKAVSAKLKDDKALKENDTNRVWQI